jgi:hypothetical protein
MKRTDREKRIIKIDDVFNKNSNDFADNTKTLNKI